MLVLFCLIVGFIGPGIMRIEPALPFHPAPYKSSHLVRFANGLDLDTRSRPGVEGNSSLSQGTYWLVNLHLPVRHEYLATLKHCGLEPVCYLAYQNLVCRATRHVHGEEALKLPFVRWLGPFLAEYKLAPELLELPAGILRESSLVDIVACVWPDENTGVVAEAILSGAGDVLSATRSAVWCRLPPNRLLEIAGLDEVSWLQMQDSVCSFNVEAQWVVQSGWRNTIPDTLAGRPAWTRNIRGQGMVVGLLDAGINTGHDMFRDPAFTLTGPGIYPRHRKIAGYKLYRNAAFGDFSSWHGSAVAGTLAGNDSLCGNYSKCDGLAPLARIFFVDVGTSYGTYVFGEDLGDLLDSVRLATGLGDPVRQLSGSVGSEARLGYYRLQEASLDAVAWKDQDFLMIWAAGNGGPAPYRLGHPSCAKNVLTLGACGNSTASNLVASFSSRGPTRDERIKPDLVAPGQSITTAYGPSPSDYSLRDGTSFSSPAASGALVLYRQYLRDGWFPLGRPDSANSIASPSSSLMRALAVVSADPNVGPDPIPNYAVGWGRLNLANIMHFEGDSIGLTFADERSGLATGEYHEYSLEIAEREPLRVVLVWTDTAAAPEALPAIVNDLNLELVSPDLNGYMGNRFSGGESRPNPSSPDSLNLTEVCLVKRPLLGTWTIRVRARNVFTAKQPYAVAVRGGIAGLPGVADRPSGKARTTHTNETGTRLVTPTHPLRLPMSESGRLLIFSASGQTVATLAHDREGNITWDGGTAPTGAYFCCFQPVSATRRPIPGSRPLCRILLLR